MRALVALFPLLLACSRTPVPPVTDSDGGALEDAGPGGELPPDAPPGTGEGRLFPATTADGVVQLMRVRPDGSAVRWGPPLSEATPPVDDVGRLLQGAEGRRALVQHHASGRTHALRGDRWVDVCPDIEATRCFAEHPDGPLRVYVLRPHTADETGARGALVSYRGERLTSADSGPTVHSPAGWSVVRSGEGWTLFRGGAASPIEMLEPELPLTALSDTLFTFHRGYSHLWLRDSRTGARSQATCPDGSAPNEIIARRASIQRCGSELVVLDERGLALTGHRLDDDSELTRVLHVQRGEYTLSVHGGHSTRTASVSITAPDGSGLARVSRTYPEVEGWMSHADVQLLDLRADADRLVAYVTFRLVGVAHDDHTLEQEHGILRWDTGSSEPEWHPIAHDGDRPDTPTYRVWFPTSADRALWVTGDGRLVAFDYEARALVDHTGALQFDPHHG